MDQLQDKDKNMQGIFQEWTSTLDTHTLTQFLESIIINAKLWMMFLDTDKNVVIWNRAAQEITGDTSDEVLGHNTIWKWIYPDPSYRRQVTRKIIENIKNKKTLENFETSIHTKNHEKKRISWNTRELVGQDKKVSGSLSLETISPGLQKQKAR